MANNTKNDNGEREVSIDKVLTATDIKKKSLRLSKKEAPNFFGSLEGEGKYINFKDRLGSNWQFLYKIDKGEGTFLTGKDWRSYVDNNGLQKGDTVKLKKCRNFYVEFKRKRDGAGPRQRTDEPLESKGVAGENQPENTVVHSLSNQYQLHANGPGSVPAGATFRSVPVEVDYMTTPPFVGLLQSNIPSHFPQSINSVQGTNFIQGGVNQLGPIDHSSPNQFQDANGPGSVPARASVTAPANTPLPITTSRQLNLSDFDFFQAMLQGTNSVECSVNQSRLIRPDFIQSHQNSPGGGFSTIHINNHPEQVRNTISPFDEIKSYFDQYSKAYDDLDFLKLLNPTQMNKPLIDCTVQSVGSIMKILQTNLIEAVNDRLREEIKKHWNELSSNLDLKHSMLKQLVDRSLEKDTPFEQTKQKVVAAQLKLDRAKSKILELQQEVTKQQRCIDDGNERMAGMQGSTWYAAVLDKY